ncbi:hypothetical protein L7F22_017702 [Adiantum nelumboides]|nr:hypothetical protein [Adiantum nelumboides]
MRGPTLPVVTAYLEEEKETVGDKGHHALPRLRTRHLPRLLAQSALKHAQWAGKSVDKNSSAVGTACIGRALQGAMHGLAGRNEAKIALLRKELESKIMNEENDMDTFLAGVKDINEQLIFSNEVISDSSLEKKGEEGIFGTQEKRETRGIISGNQEREEKGRIPRTQGREETQNTPGDQECFEFPLPHPGDQDEEEDKEDEYEDEGEEEGEGDDDDDDDDEDSTLLTWNVLIEAHICLGITIVAASMGDNGWLVLLITLTGDALSWLEKYIHVLGLEVVRRITLYDKLPCGYEKKYDTIVLVFVYSSSASDFYLPFVDVDMLILSSCLHDFANRLSWASIAIVVQVLDHARVSIVKFLKLKSCMSFDVSLCSSSKELDAVDLIKKTIVLFPAFGPLYMVIKDFVQRKGLNWIFQIGGFTSYLVFVMVKAFLQFFQKWTEHYTHTLKDVPKECYHGAQEK